LGVAAIVVVAGLLIAKQLTNNGGKAQANDAAAKKKNTVPSASRGVSDDNDATEDDADVSIEARVGNASELAVGEYFKRAKRERKKRLFFFFDFFFSLGCESVRSKAKQCCSSKTTTVVSMVRIHSHWHMLLTIILAIGAKCTHLGASLKNGVVANGHVRCPWHGKFFKKKKKQKKNS
jgi:Rieske Fe-S protein